MSYSVERTTQSTIQPRNINIRKSHESRSAGGGSISGAVREVAANPTAVIAQREREKRDLQELNDRFASYIERVRFLEADNKRLQSIIDVLKVKFEKLEETLKEMYEAELEQARKTIDETTKAKAEVELKVARLKGEIARLQRDLSDAKTAADAEIVA